MEALFANCKGKKAKQKIKFGFFSAFKKFKIDIFQCHKSQVEVKRILSSIPNGRFQGMFSVVFALSERSRDYENTGVNRKILCRSNAFAKNS